ncbi:AAA family ATPase [Roseovarius gahaiensis]|uniref:AAA family ATPase n=1 Tax=Roseovarius gahaiensis TaxID=2716691 RepID=A0A967BE05_9RHOB|nr:AAA family ATPase [Roseovarius gahaiensis]NHQ75414.1 AAA family ATPase [Roseovarius gahaiensis]
MRHEEQETAKAFLSEPQSYGMTPTVERIDTHISHLFLVGKRVFKLKRAVRLPYLDFSTPERRLAACETELRLNRRTAPELYLGVRRITAGADGPEFDGAGTLLDAVVKMRRFDQDALFDAMAQRGALTSGYLDALAQEITALHATARVDGDADGVDNIRSVLRVNAEAFQQSTVFSKDDIARLVAAFNRALETHAARLDTRARAGQVRRCHGDLHLRNICLYEGRVRLFDCLEFNDALATVDVLYDLAFLAMDLWYRGLRREASQVVNRYCDASGQEDGYVLLPFFTALRAAVRAHVLATQAETTEQSRNTLAEEARAYFDLAEHLLMPKPARLVALGGLSGSGKSTLAAALAPHLGPAPGARVIGSDRTRKAMFDTAPDYPLPPEAYSAEVSAQVYAAMAARSQRLLEDGVSVIVDAVHDRAEDRARIAAVAAATSAPFDRVWLQADPKALHLRLKTRDPGASDADADVLAKQLARAPKATDWQTVSTGQTVTDSLTGILATVTKDRNKPLLTQ